MYEVVTRLAVVVTVLLVVSVVTIVGFDRLRRFRDSWRERVLVGGPAVLLLLALLAVNSVARQAVPDISWALESRGLAYEITDSLYQVEGSFVVHLQSLERSALTRYFSWVYVYGYVFLLVFPVVAYAMLDRLDSFRGLVWAYLFNYALGLVCYTVFIAYGPRNMLPELAQPLLYDPTPEYQLLTREVNHHTNVFPSLHTSLSVTALVFAYRTREAYPKWLAIAGVLSVSVLVSTMYLAIHWATDVLAGIVLAWVSVRLADTVVEHGGQRLRSRLRSLRRTGGAGQ